MKQLLSDQRRNSTEEWRLRTGSIHAQCLFQKADVVRGALKDRTKNTGDDPPTDALAHCLLQAFNPWTGEPLLRELLSNFRRIVRVANQ